MGGGGENTMQKAIIFDMDGVLFDTERLIGEIWKQLGEREGLSQIDNVFMDCVGRSYEDTRLVFYRYYGKDFAFVAFREEARRMFFQVIETEGIPIKQGVNELLVYLQEEGYKIGLASSSKKQDILSHLNQAEIRDYFKVIIGGDQVRQSKPHPEIYQLACEQLGGIPHETFCIEDSLNGVRAGIAAGLKVIMVPDLIHPTPEILAQVHKKCSSLLEVKNYLSNKDKC